MPIGAAPATLAGVRESLLVNFVYCHPVGHAIEALHYAHGYHRADPDLRIAVAMIDTTATELAALCPFVEAVYPVPVAVFDGAADYDRVLADIPSTSPSPTRQQAP